MISRILALATCVGLGAAAANRPAHDSMKYTAQMDGVEETPSNPSRGNGAANFTLDGTKLHYTIEVHDLSGRPTMAHIHVGAKGVGGPPVFTFSIEKPDSTGRIASGTIDLTKNASATVSGDSLKALLNNGNAYVNVHTAKYPNGEIRGQVVMVM